MPAFAPRSSKERSSLTTVASLSFVIASTWTKSSAEDSNAYAAVPGKVSISRVNAVEFIEKLQQRLSRATASLICRGSYPLRQHIYAAKPPDSRERDRHRISAVVCTATRDNGGHRLQGSTARLAAE